MSTQLNLITERIIGAAIEVHRALGPGLLESSYKACVAWELAAGGLRVEREVELPLVYKEVRLECGYRMDLVVERLVVVELKVAAQLIPVYTSQLLTYLRLSGYLAGLLINFNVPVLKNGIKRLVRGPGIRRPTESLEARHRLEEEQP